MDVVVAFHRVRDAPVRGFFRPNDDEVANLFRGIRVFIRRENTEVKRIKGLYRLHVAIRTTQGAGIRAEDFVFEVARGFRARIAVEQVNIMEFLFQTERGDTSLRERQGIVIDLPDKR
jgi:hypothetical protein